VSYSENLVWMDLEMTGLDPEKERIIEIATIITDSSLAILAEGPVIYVKQEASLLDGIFSNTSRLERSTISNPSRFRFSLSSDGSIMSDNMLTSTFGRRLYQIPVV